MKTVWEFFVLVLQLFCESKIWSKSSSFKKMSRIGEKGRSAESVPGETQDSTKAWWQFFLSHFPMYQANQIIYHKLGPRGSCFTEQQVKRQRLLTTAVVSPEVNTELTVYLCPQRPTGNP